MEPLPTSAIMAQEVHRRLSRELWEPDSSALRCRRCDSKFNFFIRRHHCRLCGKIFCHACSRSQGKLPHGAHEIPNKRTVYKMCKPCYHLSQRIHKPLEQCKKEPIARILARQGSPTVPFTVPFKNQYPQGGEFQSKIRLLRSIQNIYRSCRNWATFRRRNVNDHDFREEVMLKTTRGPHTREDVTQMLEYFIGEGPDNFNSNYNSLWEGELRKRDNRRSRAVDDAVRDMIRVERDREKAAKREARQAMLRRRKEEAERKRIQKQQERKAQQAIRAAERIEERKRKTIEREQRRLGSQVRGTTAQPQQQQQQQWSCAQCTLINLGTSSACRACGAPSPMQRLPSLLTTKVPGDEVVSPKQKGDALVKVKLTRWKVRFASAKNKDRVMIVRMKHRQIMQAKRQGLTAITPSPATTKDTKKPIEDVERQPKVPLTRSQIAERLGLKEGDWDEDDNEHRSNAMVNVELVGVWRFKNKDTANERLDLLKTELKTKGLNTDEKMLYHGCATGVAMSIGGEMGFHNTAPLHGRAFGHGIYLTPQLKIALGYAKSDPTGLRTVLWCRTLLGDTERSKNGWTMPSAPGIRSGRNTNSSIIVKPFAYAASDTLPIAILVFRNRST